jgi:NTP pyrophosphatase (non-canonical NTP hydrolase)
MINILKNYFYSKNKNNEDYLCWSCEKTCGELSEFVQTNYISVKVLLDEKGFNYDMSDTPEKIALLHSEISELADAFKKGKGDDEEGAEIADIAIRLMNVPCIYPKIIDNLGSFDISESFEVALEHLYKDSPIKSIKYTAICSMHEAVVDLDRELLLLQYDDNGEENGRNYMHIISLIYTILTLLYLYSDLILHANLQELVDKKMDKNWKRPYRYNTNPKLFD